MNIGNAIIIKDKNKISKDFQFLNSLSKNEYLYL